MTPPPETVLRPQVGDIVRFDTRAHPTMGEPYEVIGRVGRDGGGLHAGNRYLRTAIGPIDIIQRHGETT